ncbi:Lipopolysaccharide biosynthesis protein wzxC [Shimwellia blattae]|nr:oligosaccharide flippase family protein [Shimwellia blattae]GAB81438.1 putative polysaccharide biosynthesis protein [Shimwellia blattae DSM 4481 = NBRC 105725]VEC20312.1 Lipopolysaccharide biosynthesis protein wzxC [Shimwellia blattae]
MISKSSIKSAAIWSSIEAISSVGLSFISIIYLARILHPSDYGYIATAQIMSSLIGMICSFGLTEAVIQRKELDDKVKETAFTGSLIFILIALLLSSIVLFCLYLFTTEKIVIYIFVFETMGVVFTILSLLPTALLLRELKMSAFTKRTLISRILFFVVTIPLALNGFGVWSVVFGNLTQSFTAMLLVFFAVRHDIPRRLTLDFKLFKELFLFGFYVMLENILWSVLSRVFSLLLAAFHGTYALGLYNMASRLTDSILGVLNTVISRMALPLFSHVQDDNKKLHSVFHKATQIFNLVSMPAFAGMAFTSDKWVPIILGDNWSEAIPVIKIISVMYAIMYSRIFVGTAMKAVGESKRFMILSAISAFLSVLTVLLTKNYTLIETVFSWAVVRVVVTIPIGIYLMKLILNMKAMPQLRPVVVPFLSTIIMSAVLIFFNMSNIILFSNQVISLSMIVLIGGITYISSVFILRFLFSLFKGSV